MISEIITLILLAVGLSADAFAVTVSNTLCYPNMPTKKKLLQPLFFGLFQGAMPLAGYFLASLFAGYIESIDHWIALALLVFLGVKMIFESVGDKEEVADHPKQITVGNLLVQAVATSIDALAVGITFALQQGVISIWWNVTAIAVITALLCCVALLVGRLGKLFNDKAGIVGGIILILIGIKIFLEHILGA